MADSSKLSGTGSNIGPGSADPPAPNQSEEEIQSVRLVEKLLSESKRARQGVDQKWMEFYRFFRGKQWKDKRPSYRHSEVLNYIFSEVQNVLVLMTDNRPRIEILPEDPTDVEFANILSEILTSKWDVNEWANVVAEAILDGSIYGTAIGCVPYKPELLDGLGDFAFESEDPFHCFPDPNAKSKINDEYCNYFITAVPTDVANVKREYPDKADLIKPDLSDMSTSSFDPYDTTEMRLKSPIDNRVLIETYRPNQAGKPNQVLKVTCYLKSYENIEEVVGEETDPTTGLTKQLYQSKKKYPNGRKIVVANGVLLSDDENPYINGKFPYAKFVDNMLPREFWGQGDVEQLKSPQEIVNKIMSYALDVLILMGNPIWVVDTEAMVETTNLTNQPGLIVEKTKGSEVRRESGVQLQPFVLQMFDLMTERVMGKLGSTADVSKGIAPSPNSSGYAIEQLQEAAQTKIRGKARNLEAFLKEVGDLMVDRILQFYSTPRIVRLTNNQNASKYFKFSVEDVADESGDVKRVATISDYQETPMGMQEAAPRQVELKSKLDIRISVGSSLPYAKQVRTANGFKLYEMGIIDAEELLEQIDYPNRDRIVEKLKESGSLHPPPLGGQNANAAPGSV